MCIHFLALISFEKKNMEDGITNGMPDFKEDENPFVFWKELRRRLDLEPFSLHTGKTEKLEPTMHCKPA